MMKSIISLILAVFFFISAAPVPAKEMSKQGQDDNYISYDNGIVYDEKTNLEWIVGPDKDISWDNAKKWAEDLSVEGGGWRLPTIEELQTLYIKGSGESNMTPLLKMTGGSVWSGETQGELKAWRFSFIEGHQEWVQRSHSFYDRTFAVRVRK